ncbi:MAG: hypothetical protein J5849_00075 [Clostridia bacterium]|nr:hypothetical protein [Clostridia bacterium]
MQKKWYRLDTAGLIFPAIARRNWSNAFRFSATLSEEVDPALLKQALDDLKKRFPSFFVRLGMGFFWYYLEESRTPVPVIPDYAYPLTFMSRRELGKNCLRVLYYQNRVAVEFFHSLTDGHGGSVFLATLVARYLELKYGIRIPAEGAVRDLSEKPSPEETEDSFLRYAAGKAAPRETGRAYRLHGTRERNGFRHLTTGVVKTDSLLEAAHRFGVSATAFLAAVMAESVIAIEEEDLPYKKRHPVRITLPVDLRKLFGSSTLRNFVLTLDVGVDPRYGSYTLEELCRVIWHKLHAEATPQHMAGMIAANVEPQQITLLRLAPVVIKNPVMDLVYLRSGENGGCLNVSNLATLELPEAMIPYVERAEFIIGPQRSYPNNCSVLTYNGRTYINMIRNIRESELERRFFSRLVDLGIAVDIETNRR